MLNNIIKKKIFRDKFSYYIIMYIILYNYIQIIMCNNLLDQMDLIDLYT